MTPIAGKCADVRNRRVKQLMAGLCINAVGLVFLGVAPWAATLADQSDQTQARRRARVAIARACAVARAARMHMHMHMFAHVAHVARGVARVWRACARGIHYYADRLNDSPTAAPRRPRHVRSHAARRTPHRHWRSLPPCRH
eukprot:1152787-Prymnesium_polylepis.1